MRITRIGPVFGAELSDVDLAVRLTGPQVKEIEAALVEHEVLVVRDQNLTGSEQLQFGRRFGDLVVSPFSPNADEAPELIVLDNAADSAPPLTDVWHADETYRPEPPKFTILKALKTPDLGGDTMSSRCEQPTTP